MAALYRRGNVFYIQFCDSGRTPRIKQVSLRTTRNQLRSLSAVMSRKGSTAKDRAATTSLEPVSVVDRGVRSPSRSHKPPISPMTMRMATSKMWTCLGLPWALSTAAVGARLEEVAEV
jgi:hypothetical protein